MKFDELDTRMRRYETAHDHCVLPGIYMVARLDGRSFTRLTRELHDFQAPFDERFRDYMVDTTEHLISVGFRVIYAYTESDEISLLFHRDEEAFGRKLRKYNSVLAGEASAKFSLLFGDMGTFDGRVSQLPTADLVCEYFRWRNEDAHRNALNGHCYWMLRKSGKSAREATDFLDGASVAQKNELLFQGGINFNDVPRWQKRGVGLFWENFEKEGFNPKTGETVAAVRRRVRREIKLPMRDDYEQFVCDIIAESEKVDEK